MFESVGESIFRYNRARRTTSNRRADIPELSPHSGLIQIASWPTPTVTTVGYTLTRWEMGTPKQCRREFRTRPASLQ